jgi:LPXTG-site transpeptidase (sortase) family protein
VKKREAAVAGILVVEIAAVAALTLALVGVFAPVNATREPIAPQALPMWSEALEIRGMVEVGVDIVDAEPAPDPEPASDVEAAPPLRLTIDAIGMNTAVEPYTAAVAGRSRDSLSGAACLVDGIITCINPDGLYSVVWQVGGVAGVALGSMPASNQDGTVFIYGHSARGGSGAFAAIGDLNPGDTAVVETANGTLTYAVDYVFDVSKSMFTDREEVWIPQPGRLLLITCDHRPGSPVSAHGSALNNLVVVLQLEVTA